MTYSSSLSMGRQRYGSRHQNSTSFAIKDARLGPISNTIILIVLACILGLLYLAQVTKTNSYGYQIESLHEKQKTLQYEHDQLEVAAAKLQALDSIRASSVAKNLVSVAPSGTIQN